MKHRLYSNNKCENNCRIVHWPLCDKRFGTHLSWVWKKHRQNVVAGVEKLKFIFIMYYSGYSSLCDNWFNMIKMYCLSRIFSTNRCVFMRDIYNNQCCTERRFKELYSWNAFLLGGTEERRRSTLHRWKWSGNSLHFLGNGLKNGVLFFLLSIICNFTWILWAFWLFIIDYSNFPLRRMETCPRDDPKQRTGTNMIVENRHL